MHMETTVLQPTGGGVVGSPAVVLPAAGALLFGVGESYRTLWCGATARGEDMVDMQERET